MALPDLAALAAEVVETVIREVRPRLLDGALAGEYGEEENRRHEDNFLSSHDMVLHERYRTLLRECMPEFVYASEEGDPEVIGNDPDPDLLALVDPLDTSELAVRGLLGYTHLMIYSRSLARPIVAVVGDIFHHVQLYVGARYEDGRDRACVFLEGSRDARPISPKPVAGLSSALVTNYLMRPGERFLPLAQQEDLLRALDGRGQSEKGRGRIGVDFGSVSLCHVAAGFTTATVEFAKGFAIWDLAPGHYILSAAGGSVIDLAGKPIALDYQLDSLDRVSAAMTRRQKFIAAGTEELAHEILSQLKL